MKFCYTELEVFFASVAGFAFGFLIGQITEITEYYTSHDRKPTLKVQIRT